MLDFHQEKPPLATQTNLRPRGPNPPAERVIVVMRQSPNWSALAAGAPYDTTGFDTLMGRVPGSTAKLIALWNAWSAISFYEVRARMKEITEANLAQVYGTTCCQVDAYGPPYDRRAAYVFTDDDDWLYPNLVESLLHGGFTVDGCAWTSIRFDGRIKKRVNDGYCYTNNYAIHGNFLLQAQQRAQWIVQHGGANEALHQPGSVLEVLDLPLSVTNKHPCSINSLARTAREGRNLADVVGRYSQFQRVVAGDLKPAGADWALPFMAEVSRFFGDLRKIPDRLTRRSGTPIPGSH